MFLPTIAFHLLSTVTLWCGFTRLPVVLEQIDRQCGARLSCSSALEDEVLFVSVRNKPLDTLVTEIASATHGEWRKDGENLVLQRTRAEESEDRKAEVALNLELIRKSLDKWIAIGKEPVWTPAQAKESMDALAKSAAEVHQARTRAAYEAQERLMTAKSVGARAIGRIFATMDLKDLAEMRVGDHRIFSLEPNRYQGRFPPAVRSALRSFERESEFIEERLRGVPPESRRDMSGSLGRYMVMDAPMTPPVNVLFRSSEFLVGHSYYEAFFIDANGNLVDLGTATADLLPTPDLTALAGIDDWGKEKLTLSRASEQATSSAAQFGSIAYAIPGADKPTLHDPLGLLFDDAVSQLAAATGKDILVDLPDECAQIARNDLHGKTLAEFCRAIGQFVSFRKDGDTLVVAPLRRDQAYRLRCRRKPLEEIIGIAADRLPSLDAAGAYVAKQALGAGETQLEDIVLGWNQCSRLQYDSMSSVTSNLLGSRQRLQFFASLSPAQRRQMADGGIRYRDLGVAQRQIVSDWLFANENSLRAQILENGQMRPARSMVSFEPTYALGDSVPPDALFILKADERLAIHVLTADGRQKVEDCDQFGTILLRQERGEWVDPAYGYPLVASSRCAAAKRSYYQIQIQYTPLISESFSLSDLTRTGKTYGAWTDLPEEWLKIIRQSYDSETKRYAREQQEEHRVPPP
ncbi:MAG TPA: hypothetical protein VG820_09850 [Fimbriimonadaceae bacterium]|nr:hypothetical protein [Fimbriimonadaceae bacterium]